MSDPFHVFRFQVDFSEDSIGAGSSSSSVPLCSGAFSEVTGLEATMEPKVVQEGGRNYGAAQRSGRVTFATVILRRGVSATRHLWQWFDLATNGSAYAHRLTVTITMQDNAGEPLLKWQLDKAIPVKFKAPDLSATAEAIGIEEIHLAHEGLRLIS